MTHRITLRVRYAETDAQGVVHHANYLTWFEEGRSDFLRQQGGRYSDWEKAGFYAVVASAEVQYKSPAFYEDEITINTKLLRQGSRILEFGYRAVNQFGDLIAEGRTRHVILDRARKPTRLPAGLMAKIEAQQS